MAHKRPREGCRLRAPHFEYLQEEVDKILGSGLRPTPAQIDDILRKFAENFLEKKKIEDRPYLLQSAHKSFVLMCDPFRDKKEFIKANGWLTLELLKPETWANPPGDLFRRMQAMGFTAEESSFGDWLRRQKNLGHDGSCMCHIYVTQVAYEGFRRLFSYIQGTNERRGCGRRRSSSLTMRQKRKRLKRKRGRRRRRRKEEKRVTLRESALTAT